MRTHGCRKRCAFSQRRKAFTPISRVPSTPSYSPSLNIRSAIGGKHAGVSCTAITLKKLGGCALHLSEAEEKLLAMASDPLDKFDSVFNAIDSSDLQFGTVIDSDGNEVELANSRWRVSPLD